MLTKKIALANEAMDAGHSWITTNSDYDFTFLSPEKEHLVLRQEEWHGEQRKDSLGKNINY